MKGSRRAALGLLVTACLVAAAPAALAGERWTPARAAGGGAVEWILGLRVRAAGGVGGGDEAPRAVVAADGSGLDPGGSRSDDPPAPPPAPASECDTGAGLDPSGAPCRP